jgi:hypothetical protein
LKRNVESLQHLSRLPKAPVLLREEVNRENAVNFLTHLKDYPAVLFVDPFGYKGVSRQLFQAFIRTGWGRDAILFFNYKRINAALSNPDFSDNMAAMFGPARAQLLGETLSSLQPHEREERVHAAMKEALHEVGVKFLHRYDFERRHDSLFFMSQNEKGLRVMKSVMKKRSAVDDHGVASFSFAREGEGGKQLGLFDRSPLDILREQLLDQFAGRTVTFEQVFQEHHPGTNYVEKNYRDVLLALEKSGEITVSPSKRRPGTFAPNVQASFPSPKR